MDLFCIPYSLQYPFWIHPASDALAYKGTQMWFVMMNGVHCITGHQFHHFDEVHVNIII